ncbi:extracellular matrix regulator RemB [Alkalibacillus haloalkaliphilus]|uniref:extracellular matrix regulator RemB n=1 Tax=Alkalibacillus haloalkaliphilus TaxID=94136 RepID=UPI0003055974|nr:extracellular matrix/biofilm biosynthesis regulator RemA family protein [Alkalibacillus haloalkaliphilus]
MFIHIGDEHVIQSDEVISIIDYTLYKSSSIIEEMIFNQRKNGNVTEVQYEEPKAIVITVDHIYFSSLSVSTLNKRAQISNILDQIDEVTEDTPE